jgi:hypothetical protein
LWSKAIRGDIGVGAMGVPGTPSGYDAESVMLSCFASNEDGEFGQYDIIALQSCTRIIKYFLSSNLNGWSFFSIILWLIISQQKHVY